MKKFKSSLVFQKTRGSISFLGAAATTISAFMLLFVVIVGKKITLYNQKRLSLYLCVKFATTHQMIYVKRMAIANHMILAANMAMFHPSTAPAARASKKAIIQMQNIYHLKVLSDFKSYRYCSKNQLLSFFQNWPYQTQALLKLKRNTLGILLSHPQKEWKTWTTFSEKNQILGTIVLQINYRLKNSLDTKLKIKAKEVLLNSKWWPGLRS